MKDFALMRHAETDGNGKITKESLEVLIRVASKFSDEVGVCDVKIYHSPTTRARVTAHTFAKHLNRISTNASAEVIGKLQWLDCESFGVRDANIARVLHPDSFALLISHQPDMGNYLVGIGYTGGLRLTNCSVYSPGFVISGH